MAQDELSVRIRGVLGQRWGIMDVIQGECSQNGDDNVIVTEICVEFLAEGEGGSIIVQGRVYGGVGGSDVCVS